MTEFTYDTAVLILSEAVEFMARKAGVTGQEIVAAIEADRGGPVERYLRQMLDVGVAAAFA